MGDRDDRGGRRAAVWAGIDVGGRRKGFHVAILREAGHGPELPERPRRLATPRDVVRWLGHWAPALVAVDSPRMLADDRRRFAGERRLAREVCRVRYTPTRAALRRQKLSRAPTYYEWIECGLEVYAALAAAGLRAIESFPTAAWTRWAGPRRGRPRARWSAQALRRLGLHGVPRRLGQDERDAIAAAATAREFEAGRCERFGTIVVPRGRRSARRAS